MTNDEKNFKEFQERWSLKRVENMILEEYTGVGENRDDFTYWVEHKLHNLGKFGGGDSGARYGIYQCKTKPKRDYGYDGIYAWQKKLGKNKEEVFSKIKQEIIKIIQLSKENKLDAINNCKNILYSGFKWKIAFHYQDIKDMKVVCIFSKNVLQKIAKGENLGENLSTAQIYEKLLGDKTYTLETMIREKSKLLWQQYGENSQEIMENPMSNNLNTQTQNTIPLNQILYGPPGTGKTYNTIDKALEILAEFKQIDSIPQTRQEQNAIFKQFKKQGQIAFITFHQSFSYEEFVEGIKPVVDDSSQNMTYKVKNGIFKKICEEAFKNYEDSKKELKQLQNEHYTESLISAFIAKLENGDIALECNGWKFQKTFRNWTYKIWGSDNRWLLLKKEGRQKDLTISIAAILKYYDEYKKKLNIKVPSPYNETHCDNEFYTATFKKLKEFEDTEYKKQDSKPMEKVPLKPYILIIDEINRGNISKILGELITLIEPSKRIGNDEELRVTLPYSQETFGVPSNLYIIGTMNTADRSIALLDTALRRRFEFIEMMPDCEELNKIFLVKQIISEDRLKGKWKENLTPEEYRYNNVNVKDIGYGETSEFLVKLLKTINHRIEFLLDREHTIGHAFFFEKAEPFCNEEGCWYELSINDLKAIFVKKIIPLLQEYFYEDYAKIDAV
ncbi:AAA family ATPase, partial [Helicobacter rodentium]|uniref:AAA family ATPase n=1 Tax=Helicobacter rodentium TaxID=59617 RepID=UPI0026EA1F83